MADKDAAMVKSHPFLSKDWGNCDDGCGSFGMQLMELYEAIVAALWI